MNETEIYGESENIKELLRVAKRAALTDATVLITGESGTGKELFAKYIQRAGSRRDNSYIVINCAAIPSGLLESEFFGHVKGAFTDAINDYDGKFLAANGGTIFLDEIGEMALPLQAKLLRFIQYRVFLPVGSNRELSSDVRIIAATNKDLVKLINEGLFREDLYYRLNVVPIKLPPLRERVADILTISNAFLRMYSSLYRKGIKAFDKDVKRLLLSYKWPGNVRELQNLIERVVVLSEGDIITKKCIAAFDENILADSRREKTLKEAVEGFKRDYIIYCLNLNDWHQTKTAKMLDIQRTYLARLIKELKISKL